MATELFSVYQFFPDGTHEQVLHSVPAEEAVEKAYRCTTSVGARIGTTVRVIITDQDDNTCFEWKPGEGVVFPLRFMSGEPKREG